MIKFININYLLLQFLFFYLLMDESYMFCMYKTTYLHTHYLFHLLLIFVLLLSMHESYYATFNYFPVDRLGMGN
jgi:hypothetical protein